MTLTYRIAFLSLVALLGFSPLASAQTKLPPNVIAEVNGKAIPTAWLEQNVQVSVAQGQKDTPELRNAIITELILREILVQEAEKQDLDKTPAAQATSWMQAKQNFLVEQLWNAYQTKHPITDADIKNVYDQEGVYTKGMDQFKLSLITVANQADAKAIITRLQKGEAFQKIAKEKSTDASNTKGGDLGWLLPDQVLPAISNVIVNLQKGALAVAPIQTASGWNIVKVDDRRPYKRPSLEESKAQIRQALQQRNRMEYLKKLSEGAKIVQ